MKQLHIAPLYHFPTISDLRVTKTGRVVFRLPDPDALSEVQVLLTDVTHLRLTNTNTIVLDTAYANYTLTVTPDMAHPVYDVLRTTWYYYLGLLDCDEHPNAALERNTPVDIRLRP